MKVLSDLKYSKEHEWVKVDGEIATCGITDFAQAKLTDVVFVELPEKGKVVEQDKQVAVIESVKSVSDIFAPVSGEIIEVNERVKDTPELINKSPYEEGWIFKIKVKDPAELDKLMSSAEYEDMTKE